MGHFLKYDWSKSRLYSKNRNSFNQSKNVILKIYVQWSQITNQTACKLYYSPSWNDRWLLWMTTAAKKNKHYVLSRQL
jgi:hypothetical protein